MSTALEDRLTAALLARAELVQPEDLRHLALPAPAPTPIWRRPTVVALVAAAAVAAVAVPFLLRDDQVARHPLPSNRFPLPTPEHALRGDVDGDGRPDRIRAAGHTLTVTLAADPTHAVTRRLPHLSGLVGLVDAGAPGSTIVAVTRTGHILGGQGWEAFTLERGKLRPVSVRSVASPRFGDGLVGYPERKTSWVTSDGVLMTGALDPAQDGQQRVAVQVSRAVPRAQGLVQKPVGTWCWDLAAQSLPTPCPAGASYAFDPGPHGSLPSLLPIGDPDWIWNVGTHKESWQEGGTRLRSVTGQPHTSSRYDQTYDVVGSVEGQHVSARIGKARTRLFTTYVDLGHGVRGLAAADPQTSAWNLLAVTDQGLVPLSFGSPADTPGGQFYLHPGTNEVTVGGHIRPATTWIADGRVFTRVDTARFGRYRTYEWQVTDSSGTTLEPVDLGTVCIDDFQGTYGTCTS
jgi:hypothetical protein